MNDNNAYYPKFQFSLFRGDNREEQLVIRADNFEEFKILKQKLDLMLAPKPHTNGEAREQINGAVTCDKCNREAEYREGVSKKGKAYKGIFCLDKQGCDYAKFL